MPKTKPKQTSRIIVDEIKLDQCAYCFAVVDVSDGVPPLEDDEWWEELAEGHIAGCEWVETRAHRKAAR